MWGPPDMARRRYRRRHPASGAAIVGDIVSAANRAPWWSALLLGIVPWLILAFALPAWIEHQLTALDGSMFRQMLDQVFARRIHWLTWTGNACLIAGAFFAIKNYVWQRPINRDEHGLVALIARFLGRSID